MRLADSIKELKGLDLTEEQITSILLTNQYLDTLNNFADKEGNNTILPTSEPMASKTFVHKYYQP